MLFRGFLASVGTLAAIAAACVPAFADQTQTASLRQTNVAYSAPSQKVLPPVVPGNSASRIETAPDSAGFESSTSCADCSSSTATVQAQAVPTPTSQPQAIATVPVQSTPVAATPRVMAQLASTLTLDGMAKNGLGGAYVPGNSVNRIEGESSIPLTCVNCSKTPGLKESRLFRYVAQGLDAIVVAADVRSGAHERIGFGSRPNPLAYMAALGAEDFIVDNALGPNNTHLQVGVNFLLGGFSLFNALKSSH